LFDYDDASSCAFSLALKKVKWKDYGHKLLNEPALHSFDEVLVSNNHEICDKVFKTPMWSLESLVKFNLSGLFVALAPKRLIFFIDYRANNG
jgi:hypothetical protein